MRTLQKRIKAVNLTVRSIFYGKFNKLRGGYPEFCVNGFSIIGQASYLQIG